MATEMLVDGQQPTVITANPESVKIEFGPTQATVEQTEKLFETLNDYIDVISLHEFDLGRCTIPAPPIELTDETKPLASKPYRVPEKAKDIIYNYIQNMLLAGLMIVSTTQWLSNIILVKKANGKIRPVVDFRPLNNQTRALHWPIPRIEELLQKAARHSWFSCVDLASAFNQLPLDPKSCKYTGVITEFGIFEFRVLCFGLRNGPASFANLMSEIFHDLQHIVTVYLDDLLIHTLIDDFLQHLKDIKIVLDRLRKYCLKLQPSKTKWLLRKVTYVGHEISRFGITPSQKHIEALLNYPPPKSLKAIKAFLGSTSFFRKFIDNYSKIVSPLNELLSKNRKFEWTESQQYAFESIIKELTKPPILQTPDYSKTFYLYTDASLAHLGAAIFQEDIHKNLHPIAYASRALSDSETRLAAIEVEALAVIYSLEQFKYLCWGSDVVLRTDHRPLIFLFDKQSTSAKLNRWLLKIMDFHLKVEHTPGITNVADFLSRPYQALALEEAPANIQIQEKAKHLNPVQELNQKLVKETQNDKILARVYSAIQNGWTQAECKDPALQSFAAVRKDLIVRNGLILKNQRTVIPSSLQLQFLNLLHQSHFGITKMLKKARTMMWFPNIQKAIEEISQKCETCNRISNTKKPAKPLPWPKAEGPWIRAHADFAGEFYGFMWLIIVDSFSKFPFIFQMKSTTSADIIKALESLFDILGNLR
uniref:Reverse transcriptase domain-containing protein n=1 Tax=Panagrolaimus sp. ES5 TaxID=591445 RepID=A0AC34FD78_9BILA